MDEQVVNSLFEKFFTDLSEEDDIRVVQPLLAHYTSMEVLESIITNNEIWFSNPLFMNDYEEIRFGINEGMNAFLRGDFLEKLLIDKDFCELLRNNAREWFDKFDKEHALDTYVFCFSEHLNTDTDGILSMWRGYGGNGSGVSLVFDTKKIIFRDDTPLIFGKVEYFSIKERMDWISKLIVDFCNIINKNKIEKNHARLCTFWFFERLKIFALTTKHRGFSEEHEWRVIYMPDRDHKKLLARFFDYRIKANGIEPRMKFKLEFIEGVTDTDFSLSKILSQIILGPSFSTHLARASALKMFERLSPILKDRVVASGIPYRSHW